MADKVYNLNIRNFDGELKRLLKVRAAELGRTIGGIVDEACRLWLDGQIGYGDLERNRLAEFEKLKGSGAASTRDACVVQRATTEREAKAEQSAEVSKLNGEGFDSPSHCRSGASRRGTASTQSGPQSSSDADAISGFSGASDSPEAGVEPGGSAPVSSNRGSKARSKSAKPMTASEKMREWREKQAVEEGE